MKKSQKEEITRNVRRQHDEDFDSLLEYLERTIEIDQDEIEDSPKQP